jgi:hypothetical protein
MAKKSRKRSRKQRKAVSKEQKKQGIRKSSAAKFKIKETRVRVIPSVRASDRPVDSSG